MNQAREIMWLGLGCRPRKYRMEKKKKSKGEKFCILKLEPPTLADRLDMGYKRGDTKI